MWRRGVPIGAHEPPSSSSVFGVGHGSGRGSLAVGPTTIPELRRDPAPRWFLLVAFAIVCSPVQAQAAWRSIRGADLRTVFVDHELADGVHYAYQFRSDGTFTGVSMGKDVRGTWRVEGDEFCWTQKRRAAAEECFEVQRSGGSIRLLRDGYEAFVAKLTPVKLQPEVERQR